MFDLTRKDFRMAVGGSGEISIEAIRTRVISTPIWCSQMRPDHSELKLTALTLLPSGPSQQSLEDDKWHPVAYYSKSLNAVERNYEIHDKEMLAVM